MDKQRFDVVIIGAGSAGCALAYQLCQSSGLSICLVEAGPDYGHLDDGRWPPELLDARHDPVSHDWGYEVERLEGPSFVDARAKVVGGCSAHNDCAAIWGLPADYDAWAEAGNPGWRYDDLRPLVQRVEGVSPESSGPYRGQNGPLYTRRMREDELSIYQRYFIDACVAEGFPKADDMSAPEPEEGVGPYHVNVKDSVRWNAALAFLDSVRQHPDLTILPETLTDRLIIEGNRAVGAVCRSKDGPVELRADSVVVSAGTYGSPAILMRSGIGPGHHLRDLDIDVKVDLPGVGRNLHDHPSFFMQYLPNSGTWQTITRVQAERTTYLGQTILKAKSPYCQGAFDIHILPSQVLRTLEDRTLELFVCNMAPLSRGEVLLRGKDPDLPPRILTRYLSDPEGRDMAVLTHGFSLARSVAGREPLASAFDRESEALSRLPGESEITEYLKLNIGNYNHAVGTCKMGPDSDPEAVVDSQGRVRGMEGLYVADASIMPTIPLANTNLSSMLIGMKLGDQLLGS